MDKQRSFYAIIPSDLRSNKNLTADEMLLYADITSLTNERGYCWASNSHFAELHNKSTRTISRWVSNLEKEGYIITFNELMIDKTMQRRIKINGSKFEGTPTTDLSTPPTSEMSYPHDTDVVPPHDKNVYHNNTVYNNTINNTKKPFIKKVKKIFEGVKPENEFYFENSDFVELWEEYLEMRKRKKTSLTARALNMNLSFLTENSNGNMDVAISIIENALETGWTKLYPPKQEKIKQIEKEETLEEYLNRTMGQDE
jgi:hypothetical protein